MTLSGIVQISKKKIIFSMHENFYFLITCICFMCVCHYANHQRIKNFTSKGRFFRKKMSLRKTKANKSSWGLGKGLFPLSVDLND